jgi:hypothetical protein
MSPLDITEAATTPGGLPSCITDRARSQPPRSLTPARPPGWRQLLADFVPDLARCVRVADECKRRFDPRERSLMRRAAADCPSRGRGGAWRHLGSRASGVAGSGGGWRNPGASVACRHDHHSWHVGRSTLDMPSTRHSSAEMASLASIRQSLNPIRDLNSCRTGPLAGRRAWFF